jgi:hypothetical protein
MNPEYRAAFTAGLAAAGRLCWGVPVHCPEARDQTVRDRTRMAIAQAIQDAIAKLHAENPRIENCPFRGAFAWLT